MNSIKINGKRISVPDGHSLSIINGVVFVDGKRYSEDEDVKQVNIVIEGSCGSLKVDNCEHIEVHGDVNGTVDTGGAVTVKGSVGGDVDAGGSVSCGDVDGDVDAGGAVHCGNISGYVDAGGTVFRS